MPSAAAASAFNTRLQTNWTATPIVKLNEVTEAPETSAGFVMLQYLGARAQKPVLGRRYFEEGTVRIVLKVPAGRGIEIGLSLADQLADLFRSRKFSGVETFAPSSPVLLDNNDQGNWFEFAVIVPYRYQFASV